MSEPVNSVTFMVSSGAIITVILFFVGQFLILIGSILAAHIRTKVQLTELRQQTIQTQIWISGLKSDHKTMGEKVDGISRHVAIIEGMERARAQDRPPQRETGNG